MSELPVRSYHRYGTFAHTMAPLYPDAARADALIAEAARRGIYRLPAARTLTLAEPPLVLLVFGLQLAAWAYLRRARKEAAVLGKLEFEEEMEAAVTELGIGRD